MRKRRLDRPREFIPRAILSGIQATLAEFPFNDHFWTRTFTGVGQFIPWRTYIEAVGGFFL